MSQALPLALEGLDLQQFFGPEDRHLRRLEEHFGASMVLRNQELHLVELKGSHDALLRALSEMADLLRRKGQLAAEDVDLVLRLDEAGEEPLSQSNFSVVCQTPNGPLKTRTPGQERLVKAAHSNLLTFAIGPAGTGKTYLAVAMAVAALVSRQVSRIVLTRPAVEAGENLGFLPGDLKDKVDPYLRPLYDSLFDMMDPDRMTRLIEQQIVEVAPLAFMRGRTLNHSFIILDEAQNTTPGQMKMFLTRLGRHSRAVITGDVTQVDLMGGATSGLVQIEHILEGLRDVAFVRLSKTDVVRHRLVRDIIHAYEEYEQRG